MNDRISRHPGRVRMIAVDGRANTFDMIRADDPEQVGTPLNKQTFLTDDVAAKYGLDENATPNEAFDKLSNLLPTDYVLQHVWARTEYTPEREELTYGDYRDLLLGSFEGPGEDNFVYVSVSNRVKVSSDGTVSLVDPREEEVFDGSYELSGMFFSIFSDDRIYFADCGATAVMSQDFSLFIRSRVVSGTYYPAKNGATSAVYGYSGAYPSGFVADSSASPFEGYNYKPLGAFKNMPLYVGTAGTGGDVIVMAPDAVLYTKQTLTEEQKARARQNIGAVDDYAINSVVYKVCPAIIPAASGEIIGVSDSAERPLSGLKLFGKTTQDGTPTPDAPVELGSKGDKGTINIQVEIGSTVTEYEPYTAQNLTTQTPNGLPGIPVSEGGNYIDENRQQWIADEIDFARGVYVQRCKELVLDANRVDNVGVWGNGFVVYGTGIQNGTPVLCNRLSNHPSGSIYNGAQGISANYTANQLVFAVTNITTLDELSVWLQTHPLTIKYILADPVETNLSAEELAAYAALHTNYPNTTVFNDEGAWMEIAYTADTKIYIDNKFAALAAAVVQNT